LVRLEIKELVPAHCWEIEEFNEDLNREEIVWLDMRGYHCTCSPSAFKGKKQCIHIKAVLER